MLKTKHRMQQHTHLKQPQMNWFKWKQIRNEPSGFGSIILVVCLMSAITTFVKSDESSFSINQTSNQQTNNNISLATNLQLNSLMTNSTPSKMMPNSSTMMANASVISAPMLISDNMTRFNTSNQSSHSKQQQHHQQAVVSGSQMISVMTKSGGGSVPTMTPKKPQIASSSVGAGWRMGSNGQENESLAASSREQDASSSSGFVTINSGATSVGDANTPATKSKLSKNQSQSKTSPPNTKQSASRASSIWQQRQQQDHQQHQLPVQATQWRARVNSQANAVPKFANTNNYEQQQQHEPELLNQQPPGGASEQSQPQIEVAVSQLEKPNGYFYGESSQSMYTHTSPISPVRHETMQQATQQPQHSPSDNRRRKTGSSQQDLRLMNQQPQQMSLTTNAIEQQQYQIPQMSIFQEQQQQPISTINSMRDNRLASGASLAPPPPLVPLSPCKPNINLNGNGEFQQQQQSLLQLGSDLGKFVRSGDGMRLRSQFIFKVIRADSLTDCESACNRASGNNLLDSCRSFNYRAYFAAENCELSRLELRQLKLGDSSQFEQHTQFDFYAAQGGDLQASAAAFFGGGGQGDPMLMHDCLDVSQSCSPDGMEFSLRTQEPFKGRIYTYGFYESCFSQGDGSTSNLLRISRSNGFPRCGTQQIGDLMTNIVVVQFNDHVQTTRDKKYNLTCYFSGPGEAVVTSNYLDTKIDERSHPLQVEHLPPQNIITSNVHLRVLYRGQPTNAIAVGDLLTFRLETKAAGSSRQRADLPEIFATNVIAKDPYSGRQVLLVDSRGCPTDPINVFPELQRTPDGALESEFYAFKIPDSNFLIFQATVRTCRAPCEPVICQAQNQHSQQAYQLLPQGGVKGAAQAAPSPLSAPIMSAPSWGRRRRRRHAPTGPQFDDSEPPLGDSIEHIIPARLSETSGHLVQAPANVITIRRPELNEAEEEVKEMFRVYMSRAELDRKSSLQSSESHLDGRATSIDTSDKLPLISNTTNISDINHEPSSQDLTKLADIDTDFEGHVCLSLWGYYVMLFSVVSLTIVMISIMIISWLVTRRGKLYLGDPLADPMY